MFLFHYTDKQARNAICNENQLRLTLSSKSRNDFTDTTYVKQVVKEMKEENIERNKFIEFALSVMDSVLNPIGDIDILTNNIFIYCLVETEDDHLANEYGKYKITFNKKKLIRCFKNLRDTRKYYKHFIYQNVIYDIEEQKRQLRAFLKEYEDKYKNTLKTRLPVFLDSGGNFASTPCTDYSGFTRLLLLELDNWNEIKNITIDNPKMIQQNNMLTNLANEFYKIAPFIKNPKFIKEREFRFAFYREKNKYGYVDIVDDKYFIVNLSADCIIGNSFIESKI